MIIINHLPLIFTTVNSVGFWLAEMAVSMRLNIGSAIALVRFFDSPVKAYSYVMYLEILSKYGSTLMFALRS